MKILITGASSGIGQATAFHFRAKGWDVVATVRKQTDCARLEVRGIKAVICDLDKPEDVEKLFGLKDLDQLDAAYLNAGFGYVAAVEDVERQALQQQFQTNVFGTWDCFSRLLKLFRKQGYGRILVCSSVVGYTPTPYRGAYAASKAALELMVQTARTENDNRQIQLSLFNPGPVVSHFRARAHAFYQEHKPTDSAHNYQSQEERLSRTSSNRKGHFTTYPEDCARLIFRCFNSPRQKLQYRINPVSHLMWWCRRLLPISWWEFVIAKGYKLEK